MMNAIGRDIPEEILALGYEPYHGAHYRDGQYMKKQRPATRICEKPQESKIVGSIREALVKCGVRDGMTVSFHHHFREGDYIVNMVVGEMVAMGIKDITIAASSLGAAHDPIAKYIEEGIVTGIQTSGIRGKMGEVVSHGKLKTPAVLRSHGARVRAIEEGEVHIDIAFIGAPTSDNYGNARAVGGKSDCGSLAYSMVDSEYADHVVVITDTLVPYPNFPASIHGINVDYVVKVDEIGNPKKIAATELRMTQDPRELMMAEMCAKIVAATPWFKDGFAFQTGGGGAALAVNRFLEPYLREKNIVMGFAIGGITGPVCDLQHKGLVRCLLDAQSFDIPSINDIRDNPAHHEISTSEYANPGNKGACVNRLDYVILGALEVDTDFNVNVIVGSDGVLRGAPGGHPDTAAGSKCSIIVAPLLRGRMATICDRVVAVTTPGDAVDVVVTDYGVAVNPRRQDIIDALDKAGIKHVSIEYLRDLAYSKIGTPDSLQWEDKVVAVMEARDGTVLDVVRQIRTASV